MKGRIILVAFCVANLFTHAPLPLRYLGYLYLILNRVIVEWVLCVELYGKLTAGSGLSLYHSQALVVHERTVIGQNFVLRHSTTIGAALISSTYDGSVPMIGNDVDIGSNVVILGDIKIGDGAIIGAGTVIVKNVEAGSVVVGNPARVIRRASTPVVINKS